MVLFIEALLNNKMLVILIMVWVVVQVHVDHIWSKIPLDYIFALNFIMRQQASVQQGSFVRRKYKVRPKGTCLY